MAITPLMELVGQFDELLRRAYLLPHPLLRPGFPRAQEPEPALGELRYKGGHRYVFRWEPPADLLGCQELTFRTAERGLSANDLGLNHRVLFDFGTPAYAE